MLTCARAGCLRPALAVWWRLCVDCTAPLLHPVDGGSTHGDDQVGAAGWDALEWAERIAPNHWGNASDDGWVTAQRCVAVASVVTGRSSGCAHTASDVAVPVVVVARAVGVLRCPACAEDVVATTSTTGHGCDRCGQVTVNTVAKLALGISDNQALTQVNESLSVVPVVVFPRVNAAHARHPAWEGHLRALRRAGVRLVYGDDVWRLYEPREAPPDRSLPWEAIIDAVTAAVPG